MPEQDASAPSTATLARIMEVLRLIERAPDAALTVESLARHAGMSPYHFLRSFERATGVTPHQYVLRTRLRAAAQRLVGERAKIVDNLRTHSSAGGLACGAWWRCRHARPGWCRSSRSVPQRCQSASRARCDAVRVADPAGRRWFR